LRLLLGFIFRRTLRKWILIIWRLEKEFIKRALTAVFLVMVLMVREQIAQA
jgi:hypothetical protein